MSADESMYLSTVVLVASSSPPCLTSVTHRWGSGCVSSGEVPPEPPPFGVRSLRGWERELFPIRFVPESDRGPPHKICSLQRRTSLTHRMFPFRDGCCFSGPRAAHLGRRTCCPAHLGRRTCRPTHLGRRVCCATDALRGDAIRRTSFWAAFAALDNRSLGCR